jgi:Divergent InlB B-repeat domain
LIALAQLSGTAHAGFSGATLRVNLSVTTASPAAQGTVVGSFTYGVTCAAASGPVLTFAPPAFTVAISAPTPAANSGDISSGNQSISSPNTCTFTQLSRPAPPTGYVWNGSPPAVTVPNINLTDPPLVYAAAFANELSLPTVTGVANPPAGGTVSCTPLTAVGAVSSCTATANPNYVFSAFTSSGCGGPSGSSPYTTSSPILDNCTVTGSFSPLYTVTANITTAGGTANCTSPIAAGITSTCTATASTGYTFVGFTPANINCGSASAVNPYVTAPLSANCVVNVAFAPIAVPTSPAASIPTMSDWIMMLLGIAILLVGAFHIGQVRRVA